jgi:hypothetical protein
MSGIVDRYRRGVLDTCRIGPTKLTYQMVWEHPANKQMGFVAHPTKSGKAGRRVNDPNWIYPGEKVGLINQNLRTQQYRQNFRGFLGTKTFTDQQVETMKDFIARRLADGSG